MTRAWLSIATLILAGEAIFALPFHVARFFRATLLDVFEFSNANLGDVFAVYGVTAMLAYFPGGLIADRFSPRHLMSVSLAATALGGFYMATIPSVVGMSLLFGYWGVTSILLFWAALIRSTREWGGELSQGRAFGILDGGRGLLAAGLASIAVVVFGDHVVADSALDNRAALIHVIYFYTATTIVASVLCWIFIPANSSRSKSKQTPLAGAKAVLVDPRIWAQALIVICAYCGYKGLDNFSLYAVEILSMSEQEAASFTANCAYLRPLAAISAGFIADRFSASRSMATLFTLMILSFAGLALVGPNDTARLLIVANILLSFAGVYALRGVYYALLEETQVPRAQTGAAVGLISLVGYTPDIFFASIGGRLLDNAPGLTGHQHYFWFLATIQLLGLGACLTLLFYHRRLRLQHNT